MKIEIEIESIQYSELIAVFLPQIKELSDDPIVCAVSHVPPELAGNVIRY